MENYTETRTEISSTTIITDSTLFSNQTEINDTELLKYDKVHRADNTEVELRRMIRIITYPIIIILGTIGNILSFIVMRRGSLKHSSTSFYMSILALADTGKCYRLLA